MSKAGEGDKRKVTTDALETLGTIISENEKRDAIHLAVENVVARQLLHPGQHVGPDGTENNPVGIVDPFLDAVVYPGQRFWLVVYPRQIHSLRHVWTHPAFPDTSEVVELKVTKKASEKWLRVFCATADCPPFEEMMGLLGGEYIRDPDEYTSVTVDGEYIHFSGRDAHGDIPPEFWDHVENYLGKKMPMRPGYFSCSC
jgi:hypothetical protein